MKALILVGALLAAPAIAQTEGTLSPEEAAKLAVSLCSDHAQSSPPITESNANELEKKGGVKYQRDAPDFLASTKSTTMGIAEYVHVPSTTGEIWAIGYDSSSCMVAALGVPVAEVEKGFKSYFDESKLWRLERVPPSNDPAIKLERFAANPRRSLRLTATVSLREANNQATITMVRTQR